MAIIPLVLTVLIFCICIFLAWYFTHKARHQERLMMIEKGMNPDDGFNKNGGVKSAMIKLGIVVLGLSIGLALIGIMAEYNALGQSNAIPMSILGITGAVALIIANTINLNKK